MLGNWDALTIDADGDGSYESSEQEPRTHNSANELEDRDPDGSGGDDPLELTYDDAGNLRLRYTNGEDAYQTARVLTGGAFWPRRIPEIGPVPFSVLSRFLSSSVRTGGTPVPPIC